METGVVKVDTVGDTSLLKQQWCGKGRNDFFYFIIILFSFINKCALASSEFQEWSFKRLNLHRISIWLNSCSRLFSLVLLCCFKYGSYFQMHAGSTLDPLQYVFFLISTFEKWMNSRWVNSDKRGVWLARIICTLHWHTMEHTQSNALTVSPWGTNSWYTTTWV